MLFIETAIIILLIMFNGLLAMSELAIVSSRKSRLEGLAQEGSRGASAALRLVADPTGFLSTVQIGITLVGILAGAFGGATIAGRLGAVLDRIGWIAPNGNAVAVAVVVVAITYLSVIIGELVPKRIALTNPERVAARIAQPMQVLSHVAAPAVWLLRHSTDRVLRLMGLSGVREATVTEDEVKSLIAEGTGAGVFAPAERSMIEGVLRLADRSVRAVMTPRAEVAWLDVAAEWSQVKERIAAARHSRLVVCQGGIDQAVGFVDTRDILPAVLAGRQVDIARMAGRLLAISERTSVLALIDLFRREGIHFAVIVDEYGTLEGVVTATDVLESIAGDLPERGEPAGPSLVRRPDGAWIADGMLPIDSFAHGLGLGDLKGNGGFETVAGFVIDRLGRLPEVGDQMVLGEMRIEILRMDGRRVDKVLVHLPAGPGAA